MKNRELSPNSTKKTRELLFSRLIENSKDLIYRYEFIPVPGFTYINPAASAITGFTPEEHYADPRLGLDLIHPESPAGQLTVRKWTRGDGTAVWTEQHNVPVYNENGELAAIEGIARDVTEREQILQALRASNSQLQRAEQIGQLGHWEWSIRDDRVSWSDGLCRLFGLEPGEFGATYAAYLERVHPEDVGRVTRAVAEALQQRGLFEFESRIVRPDGEVRHLFTRGEVLLDDTGEAEQMIGVVVDTTERVQAEQALQRTAEDLRRSNAELEQFAYVASHDLQEPLRMISSYVQLLARRYQGKLDADADEFIGYAVDGARRMQNLINDLLAYSRVGTRGNLFTAVAVEELLQEALDDLQVVIEENEAEIGHDPLPVVHGDPVQLGMVFQNLIGNAIKFRGAQAPRIHVGVGQEGNEWVFSVRDNGIGLDPKFAERIFIIFQRLNSPGTYPGTGIGLAICKRIVQRHGGRIWVDSQPGQGSVFYFTLPTEAA